MGNYGAFKLTIENRIEKFGPENVRKALRRMPPSRTMSGGMAKKEENEEKDMESMRNFFAKWLSKTHPPASYEVFLEELSEFSKKITRKSLTLGPGCDPPVPGETQDHPDPNR